MSADHIVAAVRALQAERDELRRLLTEVAAHIGEGDLPAELVAEIRRKTS